MEYNSIKVHVNTVHVFQTFIENVWTDLFVLNI